MISTNTNVTVISTPESLIAELNQYSEYCHSFQNKCCGSDQVFNKVYLNKRTGIMEFCDGKLNSGRSQLWLNNPITYAEKENKGNHTRYKIYLENSDEPFGLTASGLK